MFIVSDLIHIPRPDIPKYYVLIKIAIELLEIEFYRTFYNQNFPSKHLCTTTNLNLIQFGFDRATNSLSFHLN